MRQKAVFSRHYDGSARAAAPGFDGANTFLLQCGVFAPGWYPPWLWSVLQARPALSTGSVDGVEFGPEVVCSRFELPLADGGSRHER